MKKNKIVTRLFAFTCTLIILMSCTIVPAFANSDYDDGLLAPEDLPIWNADTGNFIVSVPDDYLNQNTILAIFDYWDYAYTKNMTNGCKLIGCTITKYGSGISSPASNKQAIALYFSPPDKNYAYGIRNSSNLNLYDWQSDTATANTIGYVQCFQLVYGNYEYYSKLDGSSISNFCSARMWGYRNIDGRVIMSDNSTLSTTTEVWPTIISSRQALENYVSGIGGETTIVKHEYDLDIGALITSVMNAPRQIFDGIFGFTLFGINIASTLISILVVAIVLWIIKHFRGD